MPSFFERYETTPLGEIFGDKTPLSIFDSSLQWTNLPTAEFLEYVERLKPAPYDLGIEPSASFGEGATFLSAQAHRIWLTLSLVDRYLPARTDAVLLDLGAFPFAIDVAVRKFLKRRCRILATFAQELSGEATAALEAEQIELLPANLDPLVQMDHPLPGMTNLLPLADDSVDVVLFAHVIEHLYHPIQILQDSLRVLKPGGRIIVTTDQGFLLGGLLNYLNNGEYVHEPVETTAAMVFNKWRGHVRFYSEGDLRKLLAAAGGAVIECALREVFYDSVPERYFTKPNVEIPRWRANLLTDFPSYRNEIMMVAEKGGREVNPFAACLEGKDFQGLAEEFSSGQCRLNRSTLADLVFGCRLLFGRWPTQEEIQQYQSSPPARGVDGLVDALLSSPEFAVRPLAARLERPGASCIIMAETEDGLRYFFSAQDTFVGFPVAVGVFEPDVVAALVRLLRKGMNCLDVGANFGFHSIRMAAAVGEDGRVFSFEPDPFSYSLLLKNRTENRMEKIITTFQVACGEEDAEVRLNRDPNPANFGGSYVSRAAMNDRDAITVPLRRVDGLIGQDVNIDLVKMDIEGYEPFALRGMRETISASRPVIVCEFNTAGLERVGSGTAAQFVAELLELKYALYLAEPFGAGTMKAFCYDGGSVFANLVCLPAERSESDALV